MNTHTPPPPPPPPADALTDAPEIKKPWSKPTIRIHDGTMDVVGSGNAPHQTEAVQGITSSYLPS